MPARPYIRACRRGETVMLWHISGERYLPLTGVKVCKETRREVYQSRRIALSLEGKGRGWERRRVLRWWGIVVRLENNPETRLREL
jgi:hypothetical protein